MPLYAEGQASHECLTRWWDWIGTHYMACEVLPQGRCKPVFSNMQTLAWNKISSDHHKNIVVTYMSGNIILDCWIKTHDGWVAGVEFLQETHKERAQSATALCKKSINFLHVELKHPSKTITHFTTKALGIHITSKFKPCEDCALGKAKQCTISKTVVTCLTVLGERLFFDIISPSTHTFVGKQHWLLVTDDSSNFI